MAARLKPAVECDLREAVLAGIRRETQIAESDIRVACDQGVVTLTGLVASNAERDAIEAAAKRVNGVRAFVNDLRIKNPRERSDQDIARDAVEALKNQFLIPTQAITVVVRDGHVTLEGEVAAEFQRMLAEAATRELRGITAVSNRIEVKARDVSKPEGEPRTLPNSSSPNQTEENALYGTNEWIEFGEAEPG
jgi:osmotically-inducible protein OsmY